MAPSADGAPRDWDRSPVRPAWQEGHADWMAGSLTDHSLSPDTALAHGTRQRVPHAHTSTAAVTKEAARRFLLRFLHAGFAVGIAPPAPVRYRAGPCPGARWTNTGEGSAWPPPTGEGHPRAPSEPARRDAAGTALEAGGEIPGREPDAGPGRQRGRTSRAGRRPPNEGTGSRPGLSPTHPAGRVQTVTRLHPLADGGGRLPLLGTPLSDRVGGHVGHGQLPGLPDAVTVNPRVSPRGPEGCPRRGGRHTHRAKEWCVL